MFICVSVNQKICSFNYARARCGYNMGNYFRHNSYQAAIIILVILYFACVCLLILYNNHVYIVLQLFWWVGVKFGHEIDLGYVCK